MSVFLFKYTILRYLLPPDYKQKLGRFAAYVRTHSAPEVYKLSVRTYAAIAPMPPYSG